MKPEYTNKEKREYQAKKMGKRVDKMKAVPRPKIMHLVWAEPHTGIDQKIFDK